MRVPREETQARLRELSQAMLAHRPGQTYTAADRLEERAAAHPDRVFLRFEQRALTYREANEGANRVAWVTRGAGLRSGQCAAVLMESRAEHVLVCAGLAKIGVKALVVPPRLAGRPLQDTLEPARVERWIVGAECLLAPSLQSLELEPESLLVVPDRDDDPALPEGAHDLGEQLSGMPVENPPARMRRRLVAGDDWLLLFTDGSAGPPRAARQSHLRWLALGDGLAKAADYGPGDIVYAALPLFHHSGQLALACALAAGACVAIRRGFDPDAFWPEVRELGATAAHYRGELGRLLLRRPPGDDDRGHPLRTLVGSGLGPELSTAFRERFGVARILECWTATEANTLLVDVDGVPGSVGRVPAGDLHNARLVRYDPVTDLHPRDESAFCIECGSGEVGELVAMIPELPESGWGRFEGFLSPEDTRRQLLENVSGYGDVWYRSGDLLRRDADGYWFFEDALPDRFPWRGQLVSAREVADRLWGFPGVRLAAAYGVRVPGREGCAPMGALALESPEGFDGVAFLGWATSRLPAHAVPLFLRLRTDLELTPGLRPSTWKLRREGYGLEAGADRLFVRDDARGGYLPLTPESLAALRLPPFERDPLDWFE